MNIVCFRTAQHGVKRITKIFNYVEVPLDHLDDGSPPAAGLLVAGPGKYLHTMLCTHISRPHKKMAVSRIRDILVRVRIRGSVPMTYGSGSCFFRQWLTRCQQKYVFKKVFGSLLFSRYIYLSFHR